jgi:hypothetical protein
MADGPQSRVAEAPDAELLLDFMQAYYAFDGHGYDREKARAALIALVQNPNFGRAWLILDGDSPAGYAVLCFAYSLEWLGRDAFVDEFYSARSIAVAAGDEPRWRLSKMRLGESEFASCIWKLFSRTQMRSNFIAVWDFVSITVHSSRSGSTPTLRSPRERTVTERTYDLSTEPLPLLCFGRSPLSVNVASSP